ncbi:MAG: phosphoribosylamine--glycine ligase [Bacteroidales bacterium]|nr:phosphoribosylamine--glycine ligase [Bacteroidales bacterium]MBN2756101.1 phosphoribosylamine--glycine ligase [Bacteroidales bacterium]
MNVLILGSGGREHALAWKINQSPKLNKLFLAPGNAGTHDIAQNIDIKINDFEAIKSFILKNDINMLIVGPEDPLVNGIHDFFLQFNDLKHLNIIGPVKAAAMLEGSKEFAKEFMQKNNIPTAKFKSFTKNNLTEAHQFLKQLKAPYVLKADGLAAGKGVLIIDDFNQALESLKQMLNGQFGSASEKVVIEEFLNGIELSVFVLTDGQDYVILPEAKDYKRIGEGDTGLNTGGMGAVSPVHFANKNFINKVENQIIKPTIDGLKKENIEYKGFIFIGLMKVDNNPYVIEYNVRLGDPETEVIIPRIKSDLLELFIAVGNNKIKNEKIDIFNETVTTVMLVSEGYPESYEKGKIISGLDTKSESIIFHAGTKLENDKILTNGGRVIAVSSFGKNINISLKKSYQTIENIKFDGKNFRKDIGFDLQ